MWISLVIVILVVSTAASIWLERKVRAVVAAKLPHVEGAAPRAGSRWEYPIVAFLGVLAGIRVGRAVVRYELTEYDFLLAIAFANAVALVVLYSFRRTEHLTRPMSIAFVVAEISGVAGTVGYFMSRW